VQIFLHIGFGMTTCHSGSRVQEYLQSKNSKFALCVYI